MPSPAVGVEIPLLRERLAAAREVATVRPDEAAVAGPGVSALVDLHLVLPVEHLAAHSAPAAA